LLSIQEDQAIIQEDQSTGLLNIRTIFLRIDDGGSGDTVPLLLFLSGRGEKRVPDE
jgi:hypothetical protein